MKQGPPRHGRMEQQLGRRYAKEILDHGTGGRLSRDCSEEDIKNSLQALEFLNKVGLQLSIKRGTQQQHAT